MTANIEYNQQAAMAVMRGQHNKRAGDYFEELIARACNEYERLGVAKIEKTPEPFKIVKPMGNGKFQGYYVSQAQPDFKGVLAGGRCIVFDAKHTDGAKIEISRLSETQTETLRAYQALGAYAGVLCSFGFRRFFWLPYAVFSAAKTENGHLYWNEKDCESYEVYPMNGYINFLQVKGQENVQ